MSQKDQDGNVAQVLFELRDKIAYITFDHVAAHNAMTVEMYENLKSVCQNIAKNSEIRVAIFRGAGGKSFVSGSDITQFASFKNGEDGVRYEEAIHSYLSPLASLPIPTIAVIDGMAVGGGLAIATCCDFRIASLDAKFGVPIARTLGNCLYPGNIAWLAAHMGMNIVRRMLLLAEMIPARELLTQGYLIATHHTDELAKEADALAERLLKLAPITQKASKLIMARIIANQLPDCEDLIRETYGSDDFRNGVASFLKGEPPVWTGK